MPQCCVFGCTEHSDRKSDRVISFCGFPRRDKSPMRYEAWKEKINRENFFPSQRTVVCTRHFTEDDFDPTCLLKSRLLNTKLVIRLKKSAIPSLFLRGEGKKSFGKHMPGRKKLIKETESINEIDETQSKLKIEKGAQSENKTEQNVLKVLAKGRRECTSKNKSYSCVNKKNICDKKTKRKQEFNRVVENQENSEYKEKIGQFETIFVCKQEPPDYLTENCEIKTQVEENNIIKELDLQRYGVNIKTENEDDSKNYKLEITNTQILEPIYETTIKEEFPINIEYETNNRKQSLQHSKLGVDSSQYTDTVKTAVQKIHDNNSLKQDSNKDTLLRLTKAGKPRKCGRKGHEPRCKECGKLCSSSKTLYSHKMSVHKGLKYKCLECDKEFTHSSSFFRHSQIHKGIRYECIECEKVFTVKQNLSLHMMVHLGVRHRCEICGNTFRAKNYVREHKRKHANIMYKCATCDKCFTQKTSLYRHRLVHKP